MSYPVLVAKVSDDGDAARLIALALRQERAFVQLTQAAGRPGPHWLDVKLGDGRSVRLFAETAGPAAPEGQPLTLAVADRGQMASLLALVEQLEHARPPRKPPQGSTLESRIPFIEDAQTRAELLPVESEKSTPPSSAGIEVEVEVEVDDANADAYDEDDAPTLMQAPAAPAAKAPAPAAAPPKEPTYSPLLVLAVGPETDSLADTMMPPSSTVERTIMVPMPAPAPARVSPPRAPEPAPQRPRLVPIPREEPTDVRRTAEPPTEKLRRDPRLEPKAAEPAKTGPSRGGSAALRPEPAAPNEPAKPSPQPATSHGGHRVLGRTIAGKYKIESSIGRGATAEVFRAQHSSLKRPVAVKVLHQENAGFIQFVKRFKAEAHTLSKLEHQNIARVIDFGQEPDGLLYLVMELLVGKSLEVLLGENGQKLAPKKVIEIGIQTCSALAFAHDEGVIHRDVKPENVVLVPHRDEDGKPCDLVKVCDFGLAKLRDPDPENTDITMGGTLCGSPAYMSPEQIVGEKLDARSDIYALATMLYEALSGELPHDAVGLTQLFAKKLMDVPVPIRKHLPSIDAALEAVIMKGLARERNDRQADARVFRQELRAALAAMPG